MKDIFIEQYNKYPEMKIEDFYKLLYQSEFGVKHLLADTLKSKKYLLEEINSISPKNEPLFEYISIDHKIIRVNLTAFKFRNYSNDSLFEVLKKSADLIVGNEKSFFSNWSILKILIEEQIISLNLKSVNNFESKFQKPLKEGHHSENYLTKYNPHYRVASKELFFAAFGISD